MKHPQIVHPAAEKLTKEFYAWWDKVGSQLTEGDPQGEKGMIARIAWHAAIEATMEVAIDMVKKEFEINAPNES